MSSNPVVMERLRVSERRLAGLVDGLDEEALGTASACSAWSVGRVMAHLGSGAEIALAGLHAGLVGSTESVPAEVTQALWAKYDALGESEATARSLQANAALVDAFEALSPSELADVRVPFFMGPVPVTSFASFRLAEHVVHTWDVEVTRHPDVELDPVSAGIILDMVLTPLVGRLARPPRWPAKRVLVRLSDSDAAMTLVLGDPVTIEDDMPDGGESDGREPGRPSDAIAIMTTGAFIRLAYGRLDRTRTPESVGVSGSVSLDELREIFPGF
ncbi:MAG: maleylpyruvate isomerase N-terminal domain-containing protein [Actinobacteria bacterium]|nr:maleylpyruvate isomerase N-terminal domain-containing protein [Actinomycetota bacterium]